MITDKIGLRVKELRTELGLSQEKLALKAEIDRTYLAGVKTGLNFRKNNLCSWCKI